MPIVQISVVRGRDRDAISRCVTEVARTVAETLDAPLSTVRVMVTEIEPEFFSVGATLKSESAASVSPLSVESTSAESTSAESTSAESTSAESTSAEPVTAESASGEKAVAE
jgi:4-oxalocrotonate tautomerase